MTAPLFDADFVDRLDELFRWRRDVRHFTADPVPDAVMETLLAAVRWAPSVGNAQPWRFVRLRSPALRHRLADHVDAESRAAAANLSNEGRRDRYATLKLHGLREAPEVLAVFHDVDPLAGHGLGRATMPGTLRDSTVIAIHTLWLAAHARGYGLGWVSILDPDAVSAMLRVPPHWSFVALLCLGRPVAPSAVPELERRDWQAREPIADRLFER
ncbi:MAG: 5,6-dimethylbenzimidazole synthase [Sphingomonas adhaesiva]|uniref:5,6-dimethylbenzimidazole synthase n=1 Tax=Sphingomonas adhaesiva TaxID=28212 RepID=UPI002FFA6CD2